MTMVIVRVVMGGAGIAAGALGVIVIMMRMLVGETRGLVAPPHRIPAQDLLWR